MSRLLTFAAGHFGAPVCRLGLATRGDGALAPEDVVHALDSGVNFLNWPGHADGPSGPDAISRAVSTMGARRNSVAVCAQFGARSASDAAAELRAALDTLGTDYVDVLTLYYVEHRSEWDTLTGPRGALRYLRDAQRDGAVRRVGITSHQRALAAEIAQTGLVDLLMIRYNAAHRGAEREVFPVADALHVPVIAYTATRWGALMRSTPDDPPGFDVPRAPTWYRFALQAPSVSVVLAAPATRAELDEALGVLGADGPLDAGEYASLIAHGDRVRRRAGSFP